MQREDIYGSPVLFPTCLISWTKLRVDQIYFEAK